MFTHVYFGEHFVFLHFFFLFIRLCLILRQWTTKHPNMKTQEGEDIDKPFIEKDWIGRGKIYNRTTLPAFVTIAMSDIVEIPRNIASNQLPAANLSIPDFLAFDLPRISSELISSKAAVWFNAEPPNTPMYNSLLRRSIPSPEFLKQIDNAFGQAWFDGAKSVVDQRFNDGKDRLPLWIISYWKEVARCHALCSLWKTSISWLNQEQSRGKTSPDLIQQVHQSLRKISWNGQMSYCRGVLYTPDLARFLGTAWLSDNHINMMIEELTKDHPKPNTKIADLLQFADQITKVHEKLALPESRRKKTSLWKYEQEVKEGRLEKLYFPLHINETHWIAGMIDFKNHTFLFGMSNTISNKMPKLKFKVRRFVI